MSLLILPRGQSVREIASRLGVEVEELKRHAAIADVDAPLAADQRVEVPDGFLRSRKTQRDLQDAMTAPSGKRGGMNMWLALDIEQKRTRAAGGMKGQQARRGDLDGLEEAQRAYRRFEAASNQLAGELFAQLTSTVNIDVRAQAFAGLACAQAQRHLMFVEPGARQRLAALSSAKAAQLADPKLPEGHLGMALALQIDASPEDLEEAREELDRATELAPAHAFCLAERARLELRAGRGEAAHAIAERAIAADADNVLALEVLAHLALQRGEPRLAQELLVRGLAATPTYASAYVLLGAAHQRLGQRAEAEKAAQTALENATSEAHKAAIERDLRSMTLVHSS